MSDTNQDGVDEGVLCVFLNARAEELAAGMLPMDEATSRLEGSARRGWVRNLFSASVAATIVIAAGLTLTVIGALRSGDSGDQFGVGASQSPQQLSLAEGFYQSAEPVRGAICVAVFLDRELATTDLWWWQAGETGCDSRTSDVVKTLASLDLVVGSGVESVQVASWLPLMNGDQERLEFTITSAPVGASLRGHILDGRVERDLVFWSISEVDPPLRPAD